MGLQERHAAAADGTAIGFQTNGTGDPVLLVHGAAADSRQWARLAPLLVPRFCVATMDRRGRGRSGPVRSDHSLEVEFGDVASVAAGFGQPVHLVGHSSGARYALHAGLRTPNLASLVLYEPPEPEHVSESVIASLVDLEASQDREGILRTFFVEVLGMSEADLSALRRRPVWPLMLQNALTVPAELRAARTYRFDDSEFADLHVPTLLLVGELSDPETRQVIDHLSVVLPNAEVVTLAGQGHGAMISAPELLAAVLQRFFDELRA